MSAASGHTREKGENRKEEELESDERGVKKKGEMHGIWRDEKGHPI